ncbi:MAG: SagB/ThcOx family dehydrogenase [Elusimicrobiota bacterium]|nr:SagB/ThcOx family dehydrogenase [Endomicrobiia bacterium]MCX7910534.1 SagB/ThcOx family dehydrogenase [Endomicrobiia bacterium]MDW8165604.1 SagB/ThcOx family dehydrogenase [Elusimicrobiota bacterium]
MKKKIIFLLLIILITTTTAEEVVLPKPNYKGNLSLEELLYKWKAKRSFKDTPLSLKQLSQLLWASSGLTIDGVSSATRVFPSAGAIYPLEIYVVCGKVENLEAGIYKYDAKSHTLKLIKKGDFRKELTSACYYQFFISQAPLSFIWVGNYNKVAYWYKERGKVRYIHIDLGHSAQNLTLQATALGLGTVQVGAFKDEEINKLLGLSQEETALYVMPVGYPK